MIQIENLNHSYTTEADVLLNVNIAFEGNECLALLGPSGCGKSTLLRILMGVEREGTSSGTLKVDKNVFNIARWNNDAGLFSIVTQQPHLLPWKTVIQNLQMVLPDKNNTSAEGMLDVVGLSTHAKKYPFELSQGMASRVSFARALLIQSAVLLADEPFAALDAVTRRRLQNWYRENICRKQASLFVTHDIDEAMRVADRIICWVKPSHRNASGSAFLEFARKDGKWPEALSTRVMEMLDERLDGA